MSPEISVRCCIAGGGPAGMMLGFLLARAGRGPDRGVRQRVIAVAYYDDLDPHCLTGGITFTANGYTALAMLCRRDGLRVSAAVWKAATSALRLRQCRVQYVSQHGAQDRTAAFLAGAALRAVFLPEMLFDPGAGAWCSAMKSRMRG